MQKNLKDARRVGEYVREMAWQWGTFRGKRVLVRVTSLGKADVDDGRVDIRFKPSDSKTYPASPGNISLDSKSELLSDDAPTPAAMGLPKPATKHPDATFAKAWVAYTDGACTGNPGPAGSGLVLLDPSGKRVKEVYRFLGTATNNIAELTAIDMVFDAVPGVEPVVIHTDSKYAIGVLTQGWKVKANGELVAKIRRRVEARPTRMRYVPGHSGVPLNERADELAREAITTRASTDSKTE
jgi:ribonuclease HI